MENITINMENLTEEEIEQLMRLAELARIPRKKVWKPALNEEFYILDSSGNVDKGLWAGDVIDEATYNIGNCYKTEAEAEFMAEKFKVIAELRHFAVEHNRSGTGQKNEGSWGERRYIMLDYESNQIFTDAHYGSVAHADIYFSSKKIAEEAIKAIGEERLKEYYF